MERHPEVPFWLCVGDVADADGGYESVPAPLHFIKGNNENFDSIASGALPSNLVYIPNGELVELQVLPGATEEHRRNTVTLRVAGLGGTHAPTLYEVRAADLPHPKKSTAKATEAADRRRHFVREEVDACKALRGVDVFLSHEAPRPFRVHRGIDAGKTPINDVLSAIQPRLHLFGHHHTFTAGESQAAVPICLDPA